MGEKSSTPSFLLPLIVHSDMSRIKALPLISHLFKYEWGLIGCVQDHINMS